MNAIETLRMFSDGSMSAHDTRALIMSMGYSEKDFVMAFTSLSAEPGSYIRVGKFQKGEMQADIYLTAQRS